MQHFTKEHFLKAAEIIESSDWVKGFYGVRKTNSICALGALALSAGIDIRSDASATVTAYEATKELGFQPLIRQFAKHVSAFDCSLGAICDWNNEQSSKEDIVATLRNFGHS
jgi:hypothetical protein